MWTNLDDLMMFIVGGQAKNHQTTPKYIKLSPIKPPYGIPACDQYMFHIQLAGVVCCCGCLDPVLLPLHLLLDVV